MKINKKQIILSSSVLLYALSITQFAICTKYDCIESGSVLIFGWIVIFAEIAHISWLANPIIFITWIIFGIGKHKWLSFTLSFLGLAISLLPLFNKKVMIDEAGNIVMISSYGIGFWLWVASLVTMVVGSLIVIFSKRRTANKALQG